MEKTTVEPVWPTQSECETVSGWFGGINRMVCNRVNTLRPLVNAMADLAKKTSLSTLIRRRQEKIDVIFEQNLKDEFYPCDGASAYNFTARNKVPGRVWRRHSALLVYQEQFYRHQYYK